MFEDINVVETGPIDYFQTIKDFSIEKCGYRKDLYYKEFFSILNFVDHLIQKIFENQNTGNVVYYDFSSWNNKELGIIVYNTVIKRLEYEHRIQPHLTKGNHNDDYQFSYSLDYGKYIMKFKYYHKISDYALDSMIRDNDRNRMTGRSTRLANDYIQTLYRKGEVNVEDHYHDYSKGYRGGNRMPDRMLMDKILRRIEFEFPEEVKTLIKANKSELYIKMDLSFKNCNKIDYNLYDI